MSAVQELLATLTAQPPSPSPGAFAGETAKHQALQNLRDSGDPSFLFLRTILELTTPNQHAINSQQQDELLFHCVLGFRHVALFRWSRFSMEFKNASRDMLLALGLNLTHDAANTASAILLSKPVANACLAASAAFWKRSWRVDSTGVSDPSVTTHATSESERHLVQRMASHPIISMHSIQTTDGLFQAMDSTLNLPLSSNAATNEVREKQDQQCHMAIMTANFLSCLIGEFSGSSGAAQYNASLEFHHLAHLAFENKGLLDVLKISMNGLGGIVSQFTSFAAAANGSSAECNQKMVELGCSIVSLTTDVLSWEFGSAGGRWGSGSTVVTATGGGVLAILVRPPEAWREYLIRPDFLGAVFQVYDSLRSPSFISSISNSGVGIGNTEAIGRLKHNLRQLLLLLSSITGIVFESKEQRLAYAGFLVDGCLKVLSQVSNELTDGSPKTMEVSEQLESETIDMCCMITRLVTNFKVEGLSKLESFPNLLSAIAAVGDMLLKQNVEELRKVQGDSEMTEGVDWRDEAFNSLLESVVKMTDDYWLIGASGRHSGDEPERATLAMATALSPLYHSYVTSRVEMAKMEEYYLTANAAELDEVREEIIGVTMTEEMTSASSIGRLDIASSVSCLSTLFQRCLPELQRMFATNTDVITPNAAAILEEARILVLCACHLLTDDSSGETPAIPESVLKACTPPKVPSSNTSTNFSSTTELIANMVQSLISLAECQASKIAANPHNPHLSPLLGQTLLFFFSRWAPAYILPSSFEYSYGGRSEGILATWKSPQAAQQAVTFIVTLCILYHCYWPQENNVQEGCTTLLLSMAKRDTDMKTMLMNTSPMEQLATLHAVTASSIHSSSENITPSAGLSSEMIHGFKRLPYKHRAQILTAVLIASSNSNGEQVMNGCLLAVQNAFSSVIQALESNTAQPHDVHTQELVCLCITLYDGVALSPEMSNPERIPVFITPSLHHISGLMKYYSQDLTICETLLRFFRDYTEQFIALLDREQGLAVFKASAELLKQYSANHCASRVIHKAASKSIEVDLEEEQNYNDVLCAIQLLINLGAKDFIDVFSATTSSTGLKSDEVTDVIFYGLEQILPLMTKGLLEFPTLCKQYFSLVGFMTETYPGKLGSLSFDLFNSLLESLLFGMSHSDSFISKSSLQGLASISRQHMENQALREHLMKNPNLFDNCSRRLLEEVVFQSIIWDRLETTALALLPLAATDLNRFASVVNSISQQLDTPEKQQRLQDAFQKLMQPEVLSKVASGAYGGRLNRMRFKKDFEEFVKDIHSTVLVF